MAQKISYSVEFQNLDASILQLREMDRLLNSIARTSGMVGGVGGRVIGGPGVGPGGNFFYAPGGGGHGSSPSAGSSAAGAALGAAGAAGASTVALRMEELRKRNLIWPGASSLTHLTPQGNAFVPFMVSKSGETDALKAQGFTNQMIYQILRHKAEMAIPPVIPGSPVIQQSKTIPGSPVIQQSKTIMEHLKNIMNAFGGGGGRRGRVMNAMGEAGIPLGKFGITVAAVTIALMTLHKVIQLFIQGIQHGAETYRQGARYGYGSNSRDPYAFGAMESFKALGIQGLDMGILQGQFNRNAKRNNVPDSEIILGAARAGQMGNVQELLNMSEEFKSAMADAAMNAKEMGQASKANFMVTLHTSELSREWHTLLSQISALISPLINGITWYLKSVLEVYNAAVGFHLWVVQRLGLVTGPGGNFSQQPGMMGKGGSISGGWEKLGFVIPGPGVSDSKVIASNTKETNSNLVKIITLLEGIRMGARATVGSMFNIPSYPSIP